MKYIILCADDYGQNNEVSQGIIELLRIKHLSATSCLTTFPNWHQLAPALIPFINQADIGLHFNLTEGKALSTAYRQHYGEEFYSLPLLLFKATSRRLDVRVIEAELEAQLDAFKYSLKMDPDFIDGHQHIHQFPIIRQALINVYKRRLLGKRPYIRSVNEGFQVNDLFSLAGIKKSIIVANTQALLRLLKRAQIPFNNTFAGIYTFGSCNYRDKFLGFLQNIQHDGLIMCHPGLASRDKADPISATRDNEFQYLASEQFQQDCQRESVILTRFQAIPHP